MKYDFTSIINRTGKDSMAVDRLPSGFGITDTIQVKDNLDCIPMWVADMNFATAPSVQKELIKRTQHPIYGYYDTNQAYFDSIIRWHKIQKGITDITPDIIGYENGVLGGLANALHTLCSQGDSVLVHSPTYIGFTNTLKNNGYNIVHSPLIKDTDEIWRMNFEDMEQKIIDNHIHVAIFCSPHNPTGRVWEYYEIEKAMKLFQKYDVFVISDEIWSDIILDKHVHIPTQSISEDAKMRTIAFYSPSKTFNLAGLIGSYHIVYNTWIRERIKKESSLVPYNSMNVLSMHALIGAYSDEGFEWCHELCKVINHNVNYACNYIQENFHGVNVSQPQGTYMLFLDCENWCKNHNTPFTTLLKSGFEAGVFWQSGEAFNKKWAIRMNLALPFSRLQEALDRLSKYVFCK